MRHCFFFVGQQQLERIILLSSDKLYISTSNQFKKKTSLLGEKSIIGHTGVWNADEAARAAPLLPPP